MSFNSGYRRRAKPLCRLCGKRITKCNPSGTRRRGTLVESGFHPLQACSRYPRVTAYFPFCGNFIVSEFSADFDDILQKMCREMVKAWKVDRSSHYCVDIGVGTGVQYTSDYIPSITEPDEVIWSGGTLWLCSENGAFEKELVIKKMTENFKSLVLKNLHDNYYYNAMLNCIMVERKF